MKSTPIPVPRHERKIPRHRPDFSSHRNGHDDDDDDDGKEHRNLMARAETKGRADSYSHTRHQHIIGTQETEWLPPRLEWTRGSGRQSKTGEASAATRTSSPASRQYRDPIVQRLILENIRRIFFLPQVKRWGKWRKTNKKPETAKIIEDVLICHRNHHSNVVFCRRTFSQVVILFRKIGPVPVSEFTSWAGCLAKGCQIFQAATKVYIGTARGTSCRR